MTSLVRISEQQPTPDFSLATSLEHGSWLQRKAARMSDGQAGAAFYGGLFGVLLSAVGEAVSIGQTDVGVVAAVPVLLLSLLSVNAALICDGSQTHPDLKISRRKVDRLRLRTARRLERKYGWKPRLGMPHPEGRDDTYDRFMVVVEAGDDAYKLRIERWQYASVWYTLAADHEETVADEEELPDRYYEVVAKANKQTETAKQLFESQQQASQKEISSKSFRQQVAQQYNATFEVQ